MKKLCISFAVGVLLLTPPIVRAQWEHIATPNHAWDIIYNPNGTYHNSLGNRMFSTDPDARTIADIFDPAPADAWATNEPLGIVQGYLNMGFDEANVSGNDVRIDHIGNSNIAGDATRDRLRINTTWLYASTFPPAPIDILEVATHELFHGTQYAYVGAAWDETVGDLVIEGQAVSFEDKNYHDADDDPGSAYLNRVNEYLDDTTPAGGVNRSLVEHDYSGALWWTYVLEQFGAERAEPAVGHDFAVRFWEIADTSSADAWDILQRTLDEFDRYTTYAYDRGVEIWDVFEDFSIANATRITDSGGQQNRMDLSALDDPNRFRYWDDPDRGGTYRYDRVLMQDTDDVNASNPVRTFSGSLAEWNSHYYEYAFDPAANGIVGFVGQADPWGDACTFSVLARKGDGLEAVYRSLVSNGGTWNLVLAQRAADPWTHFRIVVSGRFAGTDSSGTDIDTRVEFDGTVVYGSPSLSILEPSEEYPAYVGPFDVPERFLVRLLLQGPSELGHGTVEGVVAEDFTVYVGSASSGNEAEVLSGATVMGEYWLTCQAPAKSSATPTTYDLAVDYGGVATVAAEAVVIYAPLELDQVLVVDRSFSMSNDDAGMARIEAARQAAELFVDVSGSDDQLGVVAFNGDATEPGTPVYGDDAQDVYTLDQMTSDAERLLVKVAIEGSGLDPDGSTSIGDGLYKGAEQLLAHGKEGEDWLVLLSDGKENEDAYYSAIASALELNGIRVFTIGLGAQINEELLEDIAHETEGQYLYVEIPSSTSGVEGWTEGSGGDGGFGLDLADAYLIANEQVRRHERLWETRAALTEGESSSFVIPLEEGGFEEALFSFHWANPSNELAVSVRRPDGALVQDGVDGAAVFLDDPSDSNANNHVTMHLGPMGMGSWTVDVSAVEGDVKYLGVLSGKNRQGPATRLMVSQVGVDPALPQERRGLRGMPMAILMDLTDTGGPIRSADVVATIIHPRQPPVTLRLLDDGDHYDGKGDDGVYGGLYTPTIHGSLYQAGLPELPLPAPQYGSYRVVARAVGTSNAGEDFARLEKAAFQVKRVMGEPNPDTDGDGMPNRYEGLHPGLQGGTWDALGDLDGDGTVNREEYERGTHPANRDTDGGGETDTSEWTRGANPFDPWDDALPRPLVVGVVDTLTDNLPEVNPFLPESNLIYYPANPAYERMHFFRRAGSTGPFVEIADSPASNPVAHYRDTGLTNGVTYQYYVEAEGAGGTRSAPSPLFSGTPRADPIPPGGFIAVEGGRRLVSNVNVRVELFSDPDVTEVILGNEGAIDGGTWQSMTSSVAWVLDPGDDDVARVYAQFRDAAGNLSAVASDSVVVMDASTLGSVTGLIELAWSENNLAALVDIVNGPQFNPARPAVDGSWHLPILPAGTYTFRIRARDYETLLVEGVVVQAGQPVNLGLAQPVAIDTDGDRLPDAAERRWGTNLWLPDSDGDGLTDGEEVLVCGTDPKDGDSVLALEAIRVIGSQVHLAWQSVSNKYYDVEEVPTLPGPPFRGTNIPSQGHVTSVTLPLPTNTGYSYGISVRP